MSKTLQARFKVYTGTAAQWAASSVILMKGEMGYESDTNKFKFGNGASLFKDLDYANDFQQVTTLAELEQDATHRTVTDVEKAAWNAKVDQSAYDAKVEEIETAVDGKVAQTAYDTKMAAIDEQLEACVTKAVNDLENYYTKTVIDGKVSTLEGQISAIPKFDIKVVTALPTSDISYTTIYLLRASKSDTDNLYIEYIRIKGEAGAADSWEKLGEQKVDLSGYVTTEKLNEELAKFHAIAKSGKLSDAIDDSTHRLVTDAEKTAWNAKLDATAIADMVKYTDEIVIDGGELSA